MEELLADYGSEQEIAKYIEALNNDPDQYAYTDFSDDDFIEDFREYLNHNSLDESISHFKKYAGIREEEKKTLRMK